MPGGRPRKWPAYVIDAIATAAYRGLPPKQIHEAVVKGELDGLDGRGHPMPYRTVSYHAKAARDRIARGWNPTASSGDAVGQSVAEALAEYDREREAGQERAPSPVRRDESRATEAEPEPLDPVQEVIADLERQIEELRRENAPPAPPERVVPVRRRETDWGRDFQWRPGRLRRPCLRRG
jgi:hypothetical protein